VHDTSIEENVRLNDMDSIVQGNRSNGAVDIYRQALVVYRHNSDITIVGSSSCGDVGRVINTGNNVGENDLLDGIVTQYLEVDSL
jgi:hypothetical protein